MTPVFRLRLTQRWSRLPAVLVVITSLATAITLVPVPRSSPTLSKQRTCFRSIIHPARRDLTAICGYVCLGGMPDNPRTDPQDHAWFGPHDRLFTEEEGEPISFQPGPEYVCCWGWDGAGDLDGPDVDPIWESMLNKSTRPDAVKVRHDRSLLYI